MITCLHCNRILKSRKHTGRGLCFACFLDRSIRERYPTLVDCNNDSVRTGSGRLPDHPTSALPGTPEKIAVLRRRAQRGEVLFHPSDGTESNNKQEPPWISELLAPTTSEISAEAPRG